ncbi:MAG TPA: Calx-beta domain-containing protein, partial [Sedimentisphaerales bacterium]|nr:Calx-beta domain-containing protein [Sedimentisphaerales bacterium]
VGGGTLIVQTGYNTGNREYDPLKWLQDNTIRPAEGYEQLIFTPLGGEAVQITTSPAVPKVSFSSEASGNLESVTSAFIDVVLSEAQSETVTVDYSVIGGTADGEGVDYNLPSGEIVFDIGETSQQIEITVIADGIDEDDETIIIELSNPSGAEVQLGNITQHTYTIIDPRPTVQFVSSSSFVAEQDLSAQIAVSLSHTTDETATVTYSVAGGSATGGGVDYSLVEPNTLTFGPGQTAKTITISVTDDEDPEGTETVELVLSGPTNARLGTVSTHILTISDIAYAPFQDSNTVGLWLFDETDYPHTTLTDASQYEYDLCLMDSGHLAAGKFGNALQISGSSFTSAYAGFKGSVPIDEMREDDGTPSGLWGPAVAPEKILQTLAGTDWTCEFWLKLSSTPGSAVFILDLGHAYDTGAYIVLTAGAAGFNIQDAYAGFRADCPTNAAQLTNGQWHHVAFTYSPGSGQFKHYLDGQVQATPTMTTIAVQPTPAIIWPISLNHDSFGFTASSALDWRRQHRFNITVGHARAGLMAMNGAVDELRLSNVIRYSGSFALPASFSRNYGSSPAVPTGPPLLFPAGVPSTPVQIGSRKHVFIDNVMVQSMSNVTRQMNPPQDRQQLSITVDDSSWRPAVFDKDGKVHIFIPDGYSSSEGIVRLRWSTDGINFVTPNWGVINYKGSTNNDFIFYRTPMYGMAFDDLNPNIGPEELYKVTAWVTNRGIYLYMSPDGVHWRRNETCMLPLVSGGEAETYWDDQRAVYADFLKRDSSFNNDGCGGSGRRAVLFESAEVTKTWPFTVRPNPYFEGWPFPAVTCEGPIAMPTTAAGQVYRTRAMKYPWAPDTYLAFVWRFPSNDARKVDLGVSRDGVNWSFFATSEAGPWYIAPYGSYVEAMSLYGMARRGDGLWQYAEYGTGAHGGGDRIYCRLTQRLDGFVSLDAAATTGTLTTLPLVFEGEKLLLNIKASGYTRVAITNQAGTELPGFGLADCDTITTDSTSHEVTWSGDSHVSSLAGTVVRLKFEMQNAKLYAFQFTWLCDFDGDGAVDCPDLKVLSDNWLWSGAPGANLRDIKPDGTVNFGDFAHCALRWLEGKW